MKERKERKKVMDRARRKRLREEANKNKEDTRGHRCRAGTPIASVPTLRAYARNGRVVLGELRNGGGRITKKMD